MNKTTFLKSTIILTLATLLSKLLGSIIRIPLQNIAGDVVLGIFTSVYPLYMVALIISVAGLPLAISKLIAEEKIKENNQSIREIYITASLLAIMFGVFSFVIIFTSSEMIANIIGGSSTRIALIVVAGTLLVAPYMAVYRGYFQGLGDMKQTAVSQVLEQFVRVGFTLLIAYYLVRKGYSDEIVAGGVMSGSILGAFASLLYLRLKYKRVRIEISKRHFYSSSHFTKWIKIILSISIPIAIGTLTMALFNAVDSITIPYALKASGINHINNDIQYLMGIYGRGLTVVQIATVFATSIALPLVPLITQKLARMDFDGTKAIIEKTYQMTQLISWPAAVGLVVLTSPINLGLFTNMEGNTMLAIINASSVFTSFTLVSTSILQGMNLSRVAAFVILSGVGLKIIANVLFVKSFGIDGAAWASLLVYIILAIVNTIIIYKHLPFRLIDKNMIKILVASLIMGSVVITPLLIFNVESMTRLIAIGYLLLAMGIGILFYWLLLLIFKVNYINELPIGKFINKKR